MKTGVFLESFPLFIVLGQAEHAAILQPDQTLKGAAGSQASTNTPWQAVFVTSEGVDEKHHPGFSWEEKENKLLEIKRRLISNESAESRGLGLNGISVPCKGDLKTTTTLIKSWQLPMYNR